MSLVAAENIVDRIDALPPLSDTVIRLASVVADPRSSITDIVDVIRFDQAFTLELLRLCNSAYFGLARTVESLDDAVRYLGAAKLLQLVVATHSRNLLAKPQSGYGLPAGALWLHSIGVALAAQALAKPMQLPQVGLLFTAGLLHDVGKVALNEFVAEQYLEIARLVAQERISFAEAEERVLGFSHQEIGARLAQRWALPARIVNCIRYHHNPLDVPEPDPYVDAIHVADSVGILFGIGGGDDGLAYRACPAVMARRGLTENTVEAVGLEMIAEVKTVQALLADR